MPRSRKKADTERIAPRLLNVSDAAIYLGTTVSFMRSLVWNRELPKLVLGQRLLFDRKDLDAFVERRKRDPRNRHDTFRP
jgi:excisionase family DNA binding protein